ncbi:MAG: hypothetical protein K2L37_02125, partial [Lactobacillus sp.]|nr:hypothetical protein [Lactobacillus sp.]
MASLVPTKLYNVQNCPVGTITSIQEEKGEHPADFGAFPNFFYMELLESTKTDVEVPSRNNPVPINVTG